MLVDTTLHRLFFIILISAWVRQTIIAIIGLYPSVAGVRITKIKFLLYVLPGYSFVEFIFFIIKCLWSILKAFKKAPNFTEDKEQYILTPEQEVEQALSLPFIELPKMVNRHESIFKSIVTWRLTRGI